MLDIGFFELLVVGVVLIIVMGPERLPEVAKQAAFFVRKARQGMFKLRSEMQNEIQGTPFADIEKAKQEIADLKNDLKQFGRDLADSADSQDKTDQPVVRTEGEFLSTEAGEALRSTEGEIRSSKTDEPLAEMTGEPLSDDASKTPSKAD